MNKGCCRVWNLIADHSDKRGETAKALRRILFGFASKVRMRAIMEIVE